MPRPLILDLDFTLLHLAHIPGSIEVPGRTRSAWIAPATVEILHQLQRNFSIVLATARSWDGTRWVVDGFKSHGVEVTALVIEDGASLGVVGDLQPYDPTFRVEDWRPKFDKPEMRVTSFEWQLDFESCLVARCENAEKGELLCQTWASQWSEQGGIIRFFRDGRKVYVLPAEAGKWTALQRLLGPAALSAAGVGDGDNDLVWLPNIAEPATFANAKPALIQAVQTQGGYISNQDSHEGIAEILKRWL
jgi:hydroxymethylpyrimidine pyrophosphatase-like HAD family hydrolase